MYGNVDDQIPEHIKAAQQAALDRERRAADVRDERYKKNRAAQEAQAKREEAQQKARQEQLQAEREQLAQEQMERDKAHLRKEFQAAGGTESEWKGFWERNRDRLLPERMQENQASVAHPSSYGKGAAHGGTSFVTRRV
jgi:hypothetical protein